jgi:hypothetical protein
VISSIAFVNSQGVGESNLRCCNNLTSLHLIHRLILIIKRTTPAEPQTARPWKLKHCNYPRTVTIGHMWNNYQIMTMKLIQRNFCY